MSHKSSSSKFYAYLSRLRWIKRWGLMRNAEPENVMEHSWEVAVVAHALALIRNQYFMGTVDANAIATAALFHDVSEVLTGVSGDERTRKTGGHRRRNKIEYSGQ